MPALRSLTASFPKRLHGARVALLAAHSVDVPGAAKPEQQRRIARTLAKVRARHLCRLQLRSRDGDEPFLTSIDVAIDHAVRVRAVFASSVRQRKLLIAAIGNPRALRFVGSGGAQFARRQPLLRRHRVVELPSIDHSALLVRGFSRQIEPRELHSIGVDRSGRPMLLEQHAARAWTQMRARAAGDGVAIEPLSSFRSVAYQRGLIARKLKRGDMLEDILKVNAAPGFSEHHSGRAIDIGTPGVAPLDETFELSPAFAWLRAHASEFGFRMSYPRNNTLGVIYEPWHWYFFGNESR